MSWKRKSGTWPALATYVGTIVGAGIFGVPYVMSRAGIGVGLLYILVLGLVMICVDLCYAEVVLAVREHSRYPGFAGNLLGRSGKAVATLLGVVGGWVAITIYLIIGGRFLHILFGPIFGGTEFFYQLAMALVGVLVVLGGLGLVARMELVLTGLLIAVVFFLGGVSALRAAAFNLFTVSPVDFFLPYGVVLFSLTGSAVVPELEDLVGDGKRSQLRRVIIFGLIIAMIVTGFFGAAVAAATGVSTTADALSGLIALIGPWVGIVGALGGFLLIITSLFTFLMNQAEIFMLDYHVPRLPAVAAAMGIPVVIFLLGARDFITMLGLSGGVLAGLGSVIIVSMYGALLLRRGASRWRFILPVVLALFFILGAYTELAIFFS